MSLPRSHSRRVLGALALFAIAVPALSGCMTGERPTLNTAPTAAGMVTGDEAIDAVLAKLDAYAGAVYTADYSATQLYGGTTTPVAVAQSAPDRRSVTIGDVRYLTMGGSTRTCVLTTGSCTDGTDAQPVSDTGVTPDVASGAIAKRLRRAASARVGATITTAPEIAGQPATCVEVPLGDGNGVFCVLADGTLARFASADVTIELVRYVPDADEALFATTR